MVMTCREIRHESIAKQKDHIKLQVFKLKTRLNQKREDGGDMNKALLGLLFHYISSSSSLLFVFIRVEKRKKNIIMVILTVIVGNAGHKEVHQTWKERTMGILWCQQNILFLEVEGYKDVRREHCILETWAQRMLVLLLGWKISGKYTQSLSREWRVKLLRKEMRKRTLYKSLTHFSWKKCTWKTCLAGEKGKSCDINLILPILFTHSVSHSMHWVIKEIHQLVSRKSSLQQSPSI